MQTQTHVSTGESWTRKYVILHEAC